MPDEIDPWVKASERLGRKRPADSAAPEPFDAKEHSELACARAELYNALNDCVDLGYLAGTHRRAFLARRLKIKPQAADLKRFDLEVCEQALEHVYAFLDRKLAVDKLLPPAEDDQSISTFSTEREDLQ